MVVSVACGLYAFYIYDTDLERACTNFAGTSFNQVFVYHDAGFLLRNLGEGKRDLTPGRFMRLLPFGDERPRWVGRLRGAFTTHWGGLRLR